MGLLCAEHNVGNLKHCTFRISGTPARTTTRRKSQKLQFQTLWDSCAQNNTSEISTNCTFKKSGTPVRRTKRRKSGELHIHFKKYTFKNSGPPVRRTTRRKSKKMHCQESWDSCAQNKTSEISKNALLGILGLLCTELNVGNLKNMHC